MAYRHVVKNPRLQSRIFLTNWFMKIVRPGRELDNNVVQFHVPMDMSKLDIKNYLCSIYNVDVARVNTRIQEGKTKKIAKGDRLVKKKYPDYKVAYVTLTKMVAILNYGEIMGCPGCKLHKCSNHLAMKNYENLI
ncbi:hypothetical protein QZH41_019561 [Actinostola sp. cb2023]|nr:hypothetical protein QZH41_019561 [Actinostola sp. cb2023]